VAVLQALSRDAVVAAAQPFVSSAVVTSAAVVLGAVLLALLMGYVLVRPLAVKPGASATGNTEQVGATPHAAGPKGELTPVVDVMGNALTPPTRDAHLLHDQRLQEERLQTAGRMVSKVARELTGPVEFCARLAKQTLQALPENSEVRPLQEQLASEASGAANILQTLLHAADRQAATTTTDIDLEALLADAMEGAAPLLERHGLSLVTELHQPLTAALRNPGELRNAVLDLLLHVAEAAAPGSTVTLSGDTWEDHARLGLHFVTRAIADADHSSLVLAVARATIEEQGGQLRVQTEGADCRLEISLPLS
jgi:signal transduction histidine kinase